MTKRPAKGPGGRPTKYRPEYCQMVIDHMEEGASLTSFAAEIDVGRSTITLWADEHPEFMAAVTRAKAKCAAWWEKVGRNLALTGEGNATMVVFGLKNMSADDWRDKQAVELTGKDGGPIQTEDVSPAEKLKAKLDAIASRTPSDDPAG